MEYRKNQRKKSLMVCIVFIMLFILGVTAGTISYAYFSDSAKAENTLNFGKLRIELTDGTGTANTQIKLEATDKTRRLAPNDTVTITGSVGLEDNSVPAYIRMKIDIADSAGTKIISTAFNQAFMDEMSKIKDGNKQWFVVGNYLYLGNAISAGEANDFTYSASCTNTDTLTPANTIKVTDEMLIEEIKGENITITFTYQAIQSSGLSGNVKENGYTTNNATNISNILAWGQLFSEDYNEIYVNEYATSYVRGTLNETAYKTGAQVSYQMTKSPYNYFTKSVNNAGDYVAFGFFPQTIMAEADDVDVDENNKAIFNGVEYYLGSDGYLYERVKENGCNVNFKYSNGEGINKANTNLYKYFKLEPIIWQVLTIATANGQNSLLLLSVSALTEGVFGTSVTYTGSTIDSYLKGDFYNKAFTSSAKGKINNKVNVATATSGNGTGDETTIGTNTTNSTVFLLGYKDVTSQLAEQTARIRYPTDYAGANYIYRSDSGEYNGGSWWWMRSRYSDNNVYYVYDGGGIGNVVSTNLRGGLVPALYLNI